MKCFFCAHTWITLFIKPDAYLLKNVVPEPRWFPSILYLALIYLILYYNSVKKSSGLVLESAGIEPANLALCKSGVLPKLNYDPIIYS